MAFDHHGREAVATMTRRRYHVNAVWDAWRAGRYSHNRIAALQRKRLQDLVAFARARSPFYRELYSGLPAEVQDLRRLPPVTKAVLMANFDGWVTDPAISWAGAEAFAADKERAGQPYLGRYFFCTTSGSTGIPGIFIHDPRATAQYRALMMVRAFTRRLSARQTLEILRSGTRTAVIVATGAHFAGFAWLEDVKRHRRWTAGRTFRTFSVMAPIEETVAKLNEFRPAAIVGYPTAATLLAREQAAGRLKIKPILVATSGEWLSPAARQQIKDAFGCTVQNAYGASECLSIAYDCRLERLHLNDDWLILEPVDQDYQTLEPGRPSTTTLLTNLVNKVQPIIRYNLGDSITLDPEPCPCGSHLPVIRVEGRQDEILNLRTQGQRAVAVLPIAIAAVVEETPGVHRYQIIQVAPAALKIRLEMSAAYDTSTVWQMVANNLRAYLATLGLESVAVNLAAEPPRSDMVSGKFRQVWAEAGAT